MKSSKQPSRFDLISWANTVANVSVKKLQELSDGLIFAQLLSQIYSNSIRMDKLDKNAKHSIDRQKNLKILTMAMYNLGLRREVNVDQISENKVPAILDLLQWFYKEYHHPSLGQDKKKKKRTDNETRRFKMYVSSLYKRQKSVGERSKSKSKSKFQNESKDEGGKGRKGSKQQKSWTSLNRLIGGVGAGKPQSQILPNSKRQHRGQSIATISRTDNKPNKQVKQYLEFQDKADLGKIQSKKLKQKKESKKWAVTRDPSLAIDRSRKIPKMSEKDGKTQAQWFESLLGDTRAIDKLKSKLIEISCDYVSRFPEEAQRIEEILNSKCKQTKTITQQNETDKQKQSNNTVLQQMLSQQSPEQAHLRKTINSMECQPSMTRYESVENKKHQQPLCSTSNNRNDVLHTTAVQTQNKKQNKIKEADNTDDIKYPSLDQRLKTQNVSCKLMNQNPFSNARNQRPTQSQIFGQMFSTTLSQTLPFTSDNQNQNPQNIFDLQNNKGQNKKGKKESKIDTVIKTCYELGSKMFENNKKEKCDKKNNEKLAKD